LYGFGLDQEEKAILKIWNMTQGLSCQNSNNSFTAFYDVVLENVSEYTGLYPPTPSPSNFTSWSENMVSGDSGNPMFLIIDNELVLLSSWLTAKNGPFITANYNDVNTIIENLSPGQGYSLTPINLQEVYNKYAPGV
jgi:hypothetical protein